MGVLTANALDTGLRAEVECRGFRDFASQLLAADLEQLCKMYEQEVSKVYTGLLKHREELVRVVDLLSDQVSRERKLHDFVDSLLSQQHTLSSAVRGGGANIRHFKEPLTQTEEELLRIQRLLANPLLPEAAAAIAPSTPTASLQPQLRRAVADSTLSLPATTRTAASPAGSQSSLLSPPRWSSAIPPASELIWPSLELTPSPAPAGLTAERQPLAAAKQLFGTAAAPTTAAHPNGVSTVVTVTGPDLNRDGIPDILQPPAPLPAAVPAPRREVVVNEGATTGTSSLLSSLPRASSSCGAALLPGASLGLGASCGRSLQDSNILFVHAGERGLASDAASLYTQQQPVLPSQAASLSHSSALLFSGTE